MNYNKSIYINQGKTSDNVIKKQKTMYDKHNNIKRKSDDIFFYNYLNKFKNTQKDKINKIPINHRMSLQNKNMIFSNMLNDNNDNKKVKDKDYYLNLLSDIYENHSHLSNKNIIKNNLKESSSFLNMLEKKKTFNFKKKRKSKDNSTRKSWSKKSKKKLSCGSMENNNKSTNKKLSIYSHDLYEKSNNCIGEKLAAKCQSSSKVMSNVKSFYDASNSNYKKLKIQNNVENNNFLNNINEENKDNKVKKIHKKKNNKKIKDKEKEIEIEKCETKMVSKNNIIVKNANINSVKENKKKFKFCFLCCLASKDDSLSE